MSEEYPVVVVLAPLFGALLCALAGSRFPRLCPAATLTALAISLLASLGTLGRIVREGVVSYHVGGWVLPPGVGIQLQVDAINGFLLAVIAAVALIAAMFLLRPEGPDEAPKNPPFYALYLLLTVGVFGMTVTGDAFNLYVLLEVTSLASYALVALSPVARGRMAAFHYIVLGTIGASLYLLGVGYLYFRTGVLNMAQMWEAVQQPAIGLSDTAVVAFVLITVGLWIKMALFPVGGWLPNAYGCASSAAGCLLAPTVTKVSVYVMIRVMLSVFGAAWVFGHAGFARATVGLAVLAMLAGSILALGQKTLKLTLCYLLLAEIGYMVGGAWLANRWGLVGAVYHIFGDAFMTLTLFLAAGIFSRHLPTGRIEDLHRMFERHPWAMAGFTVGALGMIGVPPTCGFFSKWYLIRGGLESGHYVYVVALLVSSLINAVVLLRILEVAFLGSKTLEAGSAKPTGTHPGHANLSPLPARWTELLPLSLASAGVVLLGVFNTPIVFLVGRRVDELLAAVSTMGSLPGGAP